jgi:hypothetical protein
MRTRGRGYRQARLQSKRAKRLRRRGLCSLLTLVLLIALSRIEIAGQTIGATVGGLFIASVEARKALPPSPRGFVGSQSRAGAFQTPLLPPLPHAQAFAPSFQAKTPLPPPRAPVFQPPPVRAQRQATGIGPTKIAGLPQKVSPQAPLAGWDALVRPTPVSGGPKAPGVEQTAPPLAARKSFRPFLEKLEEKLGQGGPRKQPPLAAPAPKARATAEKATAGVPPHRLGGRRAGELLPQIGTFKPREVLAINLSAEGLAKARASDFQVVGQTELPGLGLTLTHLVPPASLNAISARELLLDLVPDGGFVLNRVYSAYRLGAGRSDSGSGGSRPVQEGGGCPAERCFGSTLIKWQPQLAVCARDLKIGIIDTGFDKTHPALMDVRHEYREFLPDGSVKASPQHGTGILALLAGKAGSGTPGLIPDASFAIASAFFDDAAGQPMSDTAQMVRALDWLKRSGVAVVNLSLAGPEDDLVHHAVRELTKSGVVVVAAVGNDGPGAPPSYPAAYEEVIAVTAVDRKLSAYRYAGRGAHIDFAAPGVDVWTAMPDRREGPQTGTSFAVPYVTAVVAVALSGAALAPDDDALSPKRRVLAKLQGNVVRLGGQGRDPTFGEGLVQAPATCQPSMPVVTASLTSPPPEPWAGTVVRALDSASEALAKGAWVATVEPVSGEGSAR